MSGNYFDGVLVGLLHQRPPLAVAKEGGDEVHDVDEGGDVVLRSVEGDEASSIRDDPAEPVLTPLPCHPEHADDRGYRHKSIRPRELPLGDEGMEEEQRDVTHEGQGEVDRPSLHWNIRDGDFFSLGIALT